jgi:hypothetical protein
MLQDDADRQQEAESAEEAVLGHLAAPFLPPSPIAAALPGGRSLRDQRSSVECIFAFRILFMLFVFYKA